LFSKNIKNSKEKQEYNNWPKKTNKNIKNGHSMTVSIPLRNDDKFRTNTH